ncbi:hypothetical protein BBU29805_A62 (plasmid) [Borreliella burgdorferi 29805]|nr:hypothetical protein BBUCA112A_A0063 [Borreliella burgdorferi CA-11.2A]ACN92451.1 hypothetical protein BBU94A_A64 [Borreliella burgdorferi 94a]ACO38392.1 hypothetical protein BBU29805_A62 [Borreliella burgdorferi 29805]AXK69593.1 hypothetical protein BbuMM1_A650 [Borreliella burgdorferi]
MLCFSLDLYCKSKKKREELTSLFKISSATYYFFLKDY